MKYLQLTSISLFTVISSVSKSSFLTGWNVITAYIFDCVSHILKDGNTRKELDMGINYKKIGLKIKEYRLKNNLTQEKLAEISDLTPIHISNIERGKSHVSLYTLEKIADALNLNITIDISDKNIADINIENILYDCCYWKFKILHDVLIATKNSLDLNMNIKS